MRAASSSSGGSWRRRPEQQDAERQAEGRLDEDEPAEGLEQPRPWRTQMVGTTAGGTMSPASTKKLTTPFHRDLLRCST